MTHAQFVVAVEVVAVVPCVAFRRWRAWRCGFHVGSVVACCALNVRCLEMALKRALEDDRLDDCSVMLLRNLGWGLSSGLLLPLIVTRRPGVLLTTSALGVGFAFGATSRECAALLQRPRDPVSVPTANTAAHTPVPVIAPPAPRSTTDLPHTVAEQHD